jgi:hypothetical protein
LQSRSSAREGPAIDKRHFRAGGPRQFAPERARQQAALERPYLPAALSALAVAAGIGYWVAGIDLIPNSTPWIGHADEIGFLALGFYVAWRLFKPVAVARGMLRLPDGLVFAIRVLRADLGNFFFIQHRRADGFLVTGKNSGSHWLKFMLSALIAAEHGLDLPAFSTGASAEDIVGHPARRRRYPGIPVIGTTHTIPSALLRFIPGFLFRRPPIVLMVRDIEPAMLSNYRKWQAEYRASLAEFAQGDPAGRRFVADAWWYVHFFNRWGAWAKADPGRVLVVRYEDLNAEPALWLARVAAHLRLPADAAALAAALQFTSKDAIRARQDPMAGEIIVPDAQTPRLAFSDAERGVIAGILRRYLRWDFGYKR